MSAAEVVWLDGRIVPAAEARVSVFDHALLTGDGVFETLRVYGGVAFAVGRHLERLARSCAGLLLPDPDRGRLRRAVADVVAANGVVDGRLRITVTGGPAPLGSERGDHGPTTIVAAGPLPAWPDATDVVVVPWPRNERGALAGLKTVSYGENVRALAYARERGGQEAIFGNTVGNLCEGTGSNVFVAVDGRLLTPPDAAGCLAGVTRALLLEAGVSEEADLPLSTFADGAVDEAFLTSSTREVQPIRSIDGQALPTTAGPLTQAAVDAFAGVLARTMDP